MEPGNRKNLYLITLSVSIAFMALGVSSSWSTPVLPMFKNNETNVDINENEIATMLSIYPIGFATGSLATRYIADKFGRRVTILGSALPIFVGSLILVFALKAWLLYLTAFTWQCGTGMISTVIGYYFVEIADKNVRATLQLITGFTFKLGGFLTLTIGPFLSYDYLNYVMLVLPVAFFLLCWWIPETPYFYLKNGNVEAARRSLRILRCYSNEKDLEDELQALQADVKNEMKNSSSLQELFTKPQYRKAIIIAAGLKLTLIMSGGVQIKQYLGLIIDDTKLTLNKNTVFIIYGFVTFVVALMSSVLVDRVGRRPLLIYSYIGTGITLSGVGFYFLLKDVIHIDIDILSMYSITPFICILLSTIISTLGYSSLMYIVPAEIFPLNVKAIAMTSVSIFTCVIAFIVAQGFQIIKNIGGFTMVFFIFSAFAIAGGIFCYYFVIETKGKNLRDIQIELQGDFYKNDVVDNKIEGSDENNMELVALRNDKV